ncbi:MAG TPA: YhfC family glutamic-type intramembrane protease [Promineifilum sp.]|nr:YhfC family glutamic-type intramembrane protease [Promineifilum sp.]
MTVLLLTINYSLMILVPATLAVFIWRRTGAPWRFFFMGAVTFVLSQVLHIPFNAVVQRSGLLPATTATAGLLITALFLGLSSGVFEEVARYLTYRFWARDARTWSRGLMLGAGHGGSEAIILGVLGAVSTFSLLAVANNEVAMNALPAEQRQVVADALAQVVNMPAPMLILGAVERVFAIACHLAMSLLVLQVFLRRNIGWLFVSIGFHAALNMVSVIAVSRVGPYWTEVVVGLFALLAVVIVFRLRGPEPAEPEPTPLPPPVDADALSLQPSDDALDRSRYS